MKDDEEVTRVQMACIQADGDVQVAKWELERYTIKQVKNILRLKAIHRQKQEEATRVISRIREERGLRARGKR